MIILHLPGFTSVEAAMARSHEIAVESGFLSPYGYWFRWVQIRSTEWALELNPEETGKLTQEEQKTLIPNKSFSIQVQPTPVYRYFDKPEYVEKFFETGALRISSFEAFSRHPDERFLDAEEGQNILSAGGENSTLYAVTESGKSCFILSTSLLGPWVTVEKFKGKACFEITHPWKFAAAIAKKLDECSNVILGSCSYIPKRVVNTDVPRHDFAERYEDGGIDAINEDIKGLLQYSTMFHKPMRFQDEHEFRIVWDMDHAVIEPKDIICQEALQFCQIVDI